MRPLHIVGDAALMANVVLARTETVAERIQRLQSEARSLARIHTTVFMVRIAELEALAAEIAEAGAAYPPGIRELARTLAIELNQRAATLEAIASRAR